MSFLNSLHLTKSSRRATRTQEALQLILEGGDLEKLRDLIRIKHGEPRVDLKWRSAKNPNDLAPRHWESGYSLLHYACAYHPEAIELLLSVGADIEYRTDSNSGQYDGRTPLYCATRLTNGSAKILLDNGANPHTARRDGWTLVHSCAGNGLTEMLRMLLDKTGNKDVNAKYQIRVPDVNQPGTARKKNFINVKNWVPLHRAAGMGHAETVKLLLERGANPNEARSDGTTALHWAAAEGRTEVVEALVNHDDTEVAKQLPSGLTPLHEAARFGRLKCVSILATKYSQKELELADRDGLTCLHYAALGGFADVCHELVNRGCRVDVRDARDGTPLHLAVTARYHVCVRRLLQLGANPRLKSSSNHNAFGLATDVAVRDVLNQYLEKGVEDVDCSLLDQLEIPSDAEVSVPRVAGMLYLGDTIHGKPNGTGSLYQEMPDGSQQHVFTGRFRDGVRDGYGTQYLRSSQSVGYASIGQKTSSGVPTTESISCVWVNDVPQYDGYCTLNSKDGVYTGRILVPTNSGCRHKNKGNVVGPATSLSQLQRSGPGSFLASDGSKYFGSWKDDRRHFWGVEYDSKSGSMYYGAWEEDLKHGDGILVYDDGSVYQGQFTHGNRGSQPIRKKGYNVIETEPNGSLYFPSGQAVVGVWEGEDVMLHARIAQVRPSSVSTVLSGKMVESWFRPENVPGEKWKGLFHATLPDPLPSQPYIQESNWERTAYVSLCGGGVFQKLFDRFVAYMQFAYGTWVFSSTNKAKSILAHALDDYKSFADALTDVLLPFYQPHFKLRRNRLLPYVSDLLMTKLYEPVFRKLYTQWNQDVDAVFSGKLRAFAATTPADFGIHPQLLPKRDDSDSNADNSSSSVSFEVYLNFVDRVHQYLTGIKFTTVYTPSQQEGDADEGTFRNASDLRAIITKYVDESVMGENADPEVREYFKDIVYPKAIAVLSALPLITLAEMKSDFLSLANETMIIELEAYQQQHGKGGKARGADDTLPVFYFVFAHAHIDHWNAEISYLKDFWDIDFDVRVTRLEQTLRHLAVMDIKVRDSHGVILSPDSLTNQVQNVLYDHIDHPSFNFIVAALADLMTWISIQLPHAVDNADGYKALVLHQRSYSLFRTEMGREITLEVLKILGIEECVCHDGCTAEEDEEGVQGEGDNTPSLNRTASIARISGGELDEAAVGRFAEEDSLIPRLQYLRTMREEIYRDIGQELGSLANDSPLNRKLKELSSKVINIDVSQKLYRLINERPDESEVARTLNEVARVLSISNPEQSDMCRELASTLDDTDDRSEASDISGLGVSSGSFHIGRRDSILTPKPSTHSTTSTPPASQG